MKPGLCQQCAQERGLVLIRHPSCEIHHCEVCGRTPADSPHNWVTLQQYWDVERRRLDREHGVITDINQLRGWDITHLFRWKPGVVKYIAERNFDNKRECMVGFAKDAVFAHLQLP